jgi:methylase of polypeptide subunit release factors
LLFYRRIASELATFLEADGELWLEIGASQGAHVKEIFSGKGEVLVDWSGKDRFFFLEIQSLSRVSCCSKND